MKSFTKDELEAVLAEARKHDEREAMMFLVAANHGLRVSETLALDKTNIVDGFLVVQRLKGSKKTTQPLLPNEKTYLENAAKTISGPFFPFVRQTIDRHIKQYCDIAGVPSFKAHFHVLKHTTGKLGFAGGMTIPELQTYLGHVNGANTMIYLQADEQEAATAFAKAMGA